MPVKTYLHIWDAFLFEGSKVLFRYAIAIFKYMETGLLKQAMDGFICLESNIFKPSVKATKNTTLLLIHLSRLHFCCVTLLSRDLDEHDGLPKVDSILAEEVDQPLLLV